ncbi:unnamed protein product [Caretta caretta]
MEYALKMHLRMSLHQTHNMDHHYLSRRANRKQKQAKVVKEVALLQKILTINQYFKEREKGETADKDDKVVRGKTRLLPEDLFSAAQRSYR